MSHISLAEESISGFKGFYCSPWCLFYLYLALAGDGEKPLQAVFTCDTAVACAAVIECALFCVCMCLGKLLCTCVVHVRV